MKGNVRIYIRVSTKEQTIERQEHIIENTKKLGYYIAGVYREQMSGAIDSRPELEKLISDLQPGDYVVAEKMDRISRLPIDAAEKLINRIKEKGAKLLIPGIVDFSDIIENTEDSISKIVLENTQELLLKLALQMARDEYETRKIRQKEGIELAKAKGKYKGRKANDILHQQIVDYHILRTPPFSIAETAKILNTSQSMVIRACRNYREINKIN